MAQNRVKGITIEINGDTTKLQDALKGVNTQLRNTGTALGDVNKLLKLDPGNITLLKQKQELLTKAIEDTKKKLEQERDALAQVERSAPNFEAWKTANAPIQAAIDTTNQKLRELREEAKKAKAAMEDGSGSAEQYDKIQAEIKATEENLKELREERKRVGDEFGNPISPEKFQALQREIADTEQGLKRLENQLKDFGSVAAEKIAAVGGKMQEVGGKITDAGKALAPVSAAAGGAIAASVKAAVDWESAMAGVMKTNEELVDENGNVIVSYDDLANAIMKMSTETASSKEEIAAVMEAAGQLGVGPQYLEDFTRTMIMLGDSTNLSADEAATALAKFANVTNMPLDSVDRLGAALVDLGNNFATDERSIVEMATRLSGAGAQIGLTEGEILGFATALSSVGIEAEMGGSAFSKAMIKMQVATETGFTQVNDLMEKVSKETGVAFDNFRDFQLYWKNMSGLDKMPIAESLGMLTSEINTLVNSRAELEGFADVAGVTAEQFVEMYGNDAVDALLAFVEGLGNTEERGESTIQMLQDMGFTEVRLRDTLTRAANAQDLFNEAVQTGNAAFSENTALNEEASKRYDTTAAKISQTKESISNLAISIGNEMLPIVRDMLEEIKRVVTGFSNLDEGTKKNIVRVGLLVAAVSPFLITLGSVTSAVGNILTLAPKVTSAIGAASKAIGIITPLVKGLFALLLTNPIAAGVAAVLALGAAFVSAYKNIKTFHDWVDKIWGKIKSVGGAIVDFVKSIGGRNTSVAENTQAVHKFASGYNQAYILQQPTIFGRGRSGALLMGGDGPGAEAVVGTDLLGRIVRENSGYGGPETIQITSPVSVTIGGQEFRKIVTQTIKLNDFLTGGRG